MRLTLDRNQVNMRLMPQKTLNPGTNRETRRFSYFYLRYRAAISIYAAAVETKRETNGRSTGEEEEVEEE